MPREDAPEPGATGTGTITCPLCGHAAQERVPLDACRFFYACRGCGETLRPLQGDCCVFCSYGSQKCPPVQARERSA